MITLSKYLEIIIDDLIKDETVGSWKLFKQLLTVVDIVLPPRIISVYAEQLKDFVAVMNPLFLKMFNTLKPKLHLSIYYCRIMLENGPLGHF